MKFIFLALSLGLLASMVQGTEQWEQEHEEGVEDEDLKFSSFSSLSSTDLETQQLLEDARGCRVRPRISRCRRARSTVRQDRVFCLAHPNDQSLRCDRLDALERLVHGSGGVSRFARDLVRRCAGEPLSDTELQRLRRILARKVISNRSGNKALDILQRCALTQQQLNQLKRVLRMLKNERILKRYEEREQILSKEYDRLDEEDDLVQDKKWLKRLDNYVGDADEVRKHWVKKIMKSAQNFDPCTDIKCPLGSKCNAVGQCVKVDLCATVKCSKGFTCKLGKCVEKSCKGVQCSANERCFRGSCVDKTSCEGITCKSGFNCVKGICADLTKPLPCPLLECPIDEVCTNKPDGSGSCAKRVTKKAPVEEAPPTPAPKPQAQWQAGEWSECSEPCGQPDGYRTRSVLCKYPTGGFAPAAECAANSEKPAERGDCECAEEEPVFKAEPETPQTSACSRRCQGEQSITDPDGNVSKQPCGRPACSVPDFKTVMRVCRGGAWTHCNCPKGYYPVSGGCDGTTWPHRWQYNNWNGANGWLCGGHKGKKTVHVLCARGMGACRWQTSDGGDWHRQLCPANTSVLSGGCNALGKPHILRWAMKSGNGWLCGGWNGQKRTSVLCCDNQSMRPGCKTFSRRFGDWGHLSCPRGTKLISGGCDADKPFLMRSSRPINRRTWQCGGWGGNKVITVTCCTDKNDF